MLYQNTRTGSTEWSTDPNEYDFDLCLDYYFDKLMELDDEARNDFRHCKDFFAAEVLLSRLVAQFEAYMAGTGPLPTQLPEAEQYRVISIVEPYEPKPEPQSLPVHVMQSTNPDNLIVDEEESSFDKTSKRSAFFQQKFEELKRQHQEARRQEAERLKEQKRGNYRYFVAYNDDDTVIRSCGLCGGHFVAPDMGNQYTYCSAECKDADSFYYNRMEIFGRDNHTCIYCGASPFKNDDVVLHVDHIIPIYRGGRGIAINLATSCDQCNLSKSSSELKDEIKQKVLEIVQERNAKAGIPQEKEYTAIDKGRRVSWQNQTAQKGE